MVSPIDRTLRRELKSILELIITGLDTIEYKELIKINSK